MFFSTGRKFTSFEPSDWRVQLTHGRKGDNSTEDTAAIQRAIDSCWSSGGTVVFPSPKVRRTQLAVCPRSKLTVIEGLPLTPTAACVRHHLQSGIRGHPPGLADMAG